MHVAAFFAYVLAALLGFTLAHLHFKGKTPPRALSFGHGFLVACGFVFLLAGLALADAQSEGYGWGIAALFATSASAGVYMTYRHLKKEKVPRWLIVAHGGANVITVVLLGVWMFAQAPV